MTRQEHLKYCEICTNRKLDFKKGLLCSKTSSIANFEVNCVDFSKDIAQEELLFNQRLALANDTRSGDASDYRKNKQNGLLVLMLGFGILLISFAFESLGVIVLPFGIIIWGFTVYKKGVEQEKLVNNRNKN